MNKSSDMNKWIKILNEFKEANLSQAQFCRNKNIAAHKFSYWKNKINIHTKNVGDFDNKKIIPVKMFGKNPLKKINDINISFPNGANFHFPYELKDLLLKLLIDLTGESND